jgi:sec-independent protein translocase protein TatB
MPFIGHLPELLIVLVLALLVLGPKRMIEMGSSLGKSLGELRRSLKDIPGMENFTSLGGLIKDDDQEPRHTPFSVASQFAQNMAIESKDEATTASAPAPASPTVVDAAPPPATPPLPATPAAAPHVVPVVAPHATPTEPGAE